MHRILVLGAAAALAACSQSNDDPEKAATSADPGVTQAAAATDPCSLVPNAEAVLGQPVTAGHNTNSNNTVDCQWKAADGRLCGSLTMFGKGFNEVANARVNYDAMTTSLKAFGQTTDIGGIGDEAKAVDGGILGAQLVFRKGEYAALVASGCKSGTDGPTVLAEKLAREVASHL